MALFLQTTLTS